MRLIAPEKKQQFDAKRRGFTFVEVVAAAALLTIMISSVLVMMNRFVGSVSDMRHRQEAFELARSNMETLLSESKLSDIHDSGESEINPDIQWETIVEPFYEPYKGRMWIRAVCSGSFINSKDEEEKVELEHWITNLTATQIKQILAQQDTEAEYMNLLEAGNYTDPQLATIAYLEEAQLDVEAYKDLLEDQRKLKLEFLDKNGSGDKFDNYVEKLVDEENVFLEKLGMNFDDYNNFAKSYVPPARANQPEADNQPNTDQPQTEDPNPTPDELEPTESDWVPDWNTIPRGLWDVVSRLTGIPHP